MLFVKINEAVIKSGEHVRSEKLESISGTSMLMPGQRHKAACLCLLQQMLSVNTIIIRKVNSLSFKVNVRLLCQF